MTNERIGRGLLPGFLMRLLRDARGNALAIIAASVIPMAALSGSAIDMARFYVVKVRLQQACDAGVLAGRKFMLDSNDPTLDDNAAQMARKFFKNNFDEGWFGTSKASFQASKTADNQVSGVAQTDVPVTVMQIFGFKPITLNVTCEARYDVADADIMFVLDTTGSMACPTSAGSGSCGAAQSSYTRPDGTTGYYNVELAGSKISGLRSAVLSFYDTLAQNIDPSTHIRYGFVPYTSTVNAGLSLPDPNSDLVTKWNYQSRKVIADANNGLPTTTDKGKMIKSDCDALATGRSPATPLTYQSNGSATLTTTNFVPNPLGVQSGSAQGECFVIVQPLKPVWRYAQWPLDVTQYTRSADWVTDTARVTGAKSKWQGCIEERPTVVASSFDINNLPPDLDPDLAPSKSEDANGVPTSSDTRWRPMWPEVIYWRGSNMTSLDDSGNQTNPYGDNSNYPSWGSQAKLQSGYVSCGKPVQRITTMSRSDVANYVNASDFKAIGGTYHDTGMIWGTRMISPNGIYGSDTTAWPGRTSPNRYIVFMTDGYMAPDSQIYGMYGMEYYDKRVTGGNYNSDTDYHNARFVAECGAAKARNIKVFVVSFGQALNAQLTACASPGSAYFASDNAGLTAAFQSIANQVAQLRISK